MEKLKKQSSTLKTGLNFEFLLGRTLREQWSLYKLAYFMLITSSMCPIQLFQTRFQLYCRHKNFNSCCKEEHLKGNRDWNVFRAHFTMDPDSQSPVWFSDSTYKKYLKESERAISSDLIRHTRSNLQNFSAPPQPW